VRHIPYPSLTQTVGLTTMTDHLGGVAKPDRQTLKQSLTPYEVSWERSEESLD